MYRGGISLGEVKARPGCAGIIDRLNKYSLLFLQFPTTNMFHIFMSAEPQFTCTVGIQTDILFIPVPREKMYNFLFCGKMGKRCLNFACKDLGFKCLYGRICHICFALMTLYTLDKYHCELLGLKVVSRRKLIV